ncbi:MAG: 3-hydroxybutyryl-CoA dehydrogenase [Deltaproteobacteria bacterium]|nr:MAG: 3-hydroxybutyryl-CoA dehydrogenase [Deltaproteobacteria bacterium]
MMISKVGVVGSGVMGKGIATTVASRGIPVVLVRATGGDPKPVREQIAAQLERRVKRGKLSPEERDATLGRLTVSPDLADLAGCDLVIETALEELEPKRALLLRIEKHITAGTVLVTNTSSLPLDELADAIDRPEELVALHFFNPVGAMKLVELAATTRTAPGALLSARAFCERIGKVPVEVKPSPGYVVNRLLVPMLLHAIETLEAGTATPEAIDTAMKLGAAHPMGPLALADLIGLDVVFAMATTLKRELRDKRYRAPSLLRRLVLAGEVGKKTGRGIYDYSGERPVPNPNLHLGVPGPRIAGTGS